MFIFYLTFLYSVQQSYEGGVFLPRAYVKV